MIHFECGPQFATNAADAAAAVDSDESEPAIPTSNPDEASANQIDTEPTPVDVPNIMVNSSNDPEAKLSESVTLTFFAHKENATVGQEYWHDTTNYTDKELEANPNLIFFNSEKLDPPAKDEPVQLGRMTYSNQLMDRPREFTWWGKDSTALNPINVSFFDKPYCIGGASTDNPVQGKVECRPYRIGSEKRRRDHA
jgi:hypothetical protein